MRDDTDIGFREFVGNEETIGSTINDPAALRLTSPSGTNKISGNQSDEGVQREQTQIQLTRDDSSGCIKFMAQVNGRSDDAGIITLATLSLRGFEVFVPFIQSRMPDIPENPDAPDPTHGIPPGDFARILGVYGFASDQEAEWNDQRITSWPAIIGRVDERDDFRHFPKAPIPPPIITPEERAERVLDVVAMRQEVASIDPRFELDEDGVQSYLSGRKGLPEFHDDEARRFNSHNSAFHRLGRPYA